MFYKNKNNSKNIDKFKALKVCLYAGFSDEDKLSFIDSEGNDVIEKYIDEIRVLYKEKNFQAINDLLEDEDLTVGVMNMPYYPYTQLLEGVDEIFE